MHADFQGREELILAFEDATAARIREEVMATARQTQAQQLAEMKQEVLRRRERDGYCLGQV